MNKTTIPQTYGHKMASTTKAMVLAQRVILSARTICDCGQLSLILIFPLRTNEAKIFVYVPHIPQYAMIRVSRHMQKVST